MNKQKTAFGLITLGSLLCMGSFTAAEVSSTPTPDDTQIISLRIDCNSAVGCFESLTQASDWAFAHSSATTPITIDIGPGTFQTHPGLICNSDGYVSFKGAGRDNSIITGQAITYAPTGGVNVGFVLGIRNCVSLSFQDLTLLLHNSPAGMTGGVRWDGAGDSSWSNVLVDVGNVGWWDTPGDFNEHYWFGSHIKVGTGGGWYYRTSIYAESGKTWFYGGDLESFSNQTLVPGIHNIAPVRAVDNGDVRLFGTSIRASQNTHSGAVDDLGGTYGTWGLRADGGSIHAHGCVVNVYTKASASTDGACSNIRATGSGSVHTPGTAFVSNCDDGARKKRIFSGGTANVESPFWWGQGDNPSTDILSQTGQDMFVESDCSSTGCDLTPVGDETHLLIYNSSCADPSFGPWYDVNMNKCRGQ